MHPVVKKTLHIFKYFLLSIAVLLVLLLVVINLPFVHGLIATKTNSLLKEKGLPVSVGAISLSLGGDVELKDVKILTTDNDTMIYAGGIKVAFSVIPLFSKKIIVSEIYVDNATARLSTDSAGRLDLISLFSYSNAATNEKQVSDNPWEIQVDKVHLNNIDFLYSDSLNGIFIGQSLVKAEMGFDSFSLINKQIDIGIIRIETTKGFATVPPAPADSVHTGSSSWKFSAREIELLDVFYTYQNPASRQKLSASFKRAFTSVKLLDLTRKELSVTELKLDAPLVDYTPSVEVQVKIEADKEEIVISTNESWNISCKKFGIQNGYFTIDTVYAQPGNKLAQWMPVQEINTSINDIHYSSNKTGCKVDQLSLSIPNKIILQSGQIALSVDSMIKGSIVMDLKALTNMEYTGSFSENETVSLSTILSGSMDLLNIEKLNIITFSGAEIDVTGSIADVTEIPDSKCKIAFHTNPVSRNQAMNILALFDSVPALPDFKPCAISGSIGNTFNYPDFDIKIISASGNIGLTGNYDLKTNFSKLDATLNNIKIKEMFGEEYPENLTANLKWDGKLGGLNELSGQGLVEVDEVVYRDLVSHDFNLNFNVDKNLCRFSILADDTTLSCNINGEVGGSNLSYHGQLAGNFSFNEDRSSLLPGNCKLSSGILASFSYSPDNMESSLDLFNILLGKDDNSIYLDSMLWNLSMRDTGIRTTLNGDFITAEFNCRSGYPEFSDAIKKIGFEKILKLDSTNFINSSGFAALPVFDFTVDAAYDSIFNMFIPDSVFSFNDVNLVAVKSEINQQVNLDLSVDSISFGNVQGFGTKVVMIADEKILTGTLTIDSTNINGVWGGPTEFKIDILPDKITASVLVADSSGLPVYRLGAEALKGNSRVLFKSSTPDWILNSGQWTFLAPEFLTLEIPSGDLIASLNLAHEDMLIDLSGRKSDSLKLILKNVLLSQLISPKVVANAPDGVLDATIIYSDHDGKYANFDLNVKDLTWKGVVMDKIDANGYFSIDVSGNMKSELTALLNDSSELTLKIIPGDNISGNNISAVFNHLPVILIEPFTQEYINKLNGFASGELSISGVSKNPVIDGNIRLKAITLNIVPLQAWFTIPDDAIIIKSNLIYFDRFMILDSLQKQLFVDGTLDIETTDRIIADLQVRLDDIRVMNTTIKDNPEFFGSIIVNSGLKITGPVTHPSIKGNVILQDGTNVTYRQINDITVREAQQTVTFASLSGDSTETIIPIARMREISGMPAIQTTIDINPKSKFNIEISRGYDIHIGVSGSGLLNYAMLPNNSMSLTGNYEINQGTADLKFTGWPIKKFLITPGSSLRWDGDIADPAINLEATTKVEGSYVNPVDGKTRYVDFIVSMKLSNQLSKLDIVFSVKSPDQYITSVLNALPEDEQMRQAINLLIFESINLPNIESSSNYLDSQINSFWESQLNAITKTRFKYVDLSFGVDSYTQTTSGGAEEEKTSLTYEMEKKFFRDRASVKIGGRFNDDPQAGEQANTVVENFIFEYELDSLKRNLIKLYTRKDYEDILDGEVTKSGVGYIYRRSYPDFRSIWKRKNRTPRITEPATPLIN